MVRNYLKQLVTELKYLEENVFDVILNSGEVRKVEFKVWELPKKFRRVKAVGKGSPVSK